METLRGKLLIASSQMADPNFSRAVVLLIQHSEAGALGLILNRPLQISVREVCSQSLGEECEVEGVLHQGGPCDGPLMVLHRSEFEKDLDVMPGLFFTTERSKIQTLLRQGSPNARYFVGYSGWGAGQIENEMETESWVIVESDAATIFNSKETLWAKLNTRRFVGDWVDPEHLPDDPSIN
jgi:putative transcriptional regulator